jgi:hypothetical protein
MVDLWINTFHVMSCSGSDFGVQGVKDSHHKYSLLMLYSVECSVKACNVQQQASVEIKTRTV